MRVVIWIAETIIKMALAFVLAFLAALIWPLTKSL